MMKNRQSSLFHSNIFLTAGLFVFCILIFHCKNVEADDVMKVGYRVLAPHSFIGNQDSKPSGAAVEYMEKYIAPKMSVNIEWSFLPFSRLMKYLNEGKIDAVLLLGKNTERQEKYLYPAKPLTSESAGLAFKNTHPLTRINTVDDLKGLTIGFTKDGYLSPFMKNEQIRFEFTVGTENIWQQLLMKVVKERIDAAYNPTLATLKYDAKLMGLTDKLKFIELPEPPVDLYVVFSKSAADLYKRYDQIHMELRETVKYQDILKNYLE